MVLTTSSTADLYSMLPDVTWISTEIQLVRSPKSELFPVVPSQAVSQANEVIREQFFHSIKCQMQIFQTNLFSVISQTTALWVRNSWIVLHKLFRDIWHTF